MVLRLTEGSCVSCVCLLCSSVQILGVLEVLVKYGYYDDPKDIETLLEPFLSMLSGWNDTPGGSECLCDACFCFCSVQGMHMYCAYVKGDT